jgi:hypothetical protein
MNTTVAVAIAIAALAGLGSLALILRFLWRVYERGGRADLSVAAKALRNQCQCHLTQKSRW